MLLNNFAGKYGGDAAIAGMSIVTRVIMMMISALIGFFFCVKWGTVFLTAFAVLSFIFAPDIIGWFRDDPDVIAIGQTALRCQSCVLPLAPFTIMTNMMLQSMGRGVKATITSSAKNGICFIPLILILPGILGLLGVQITQTCADILSLAVSVPMVVSELRLLKNENSTTQA